jgi:hypothetical protein
MQKYKNTVLTAIIASEASHIFCCVLPTVFSIASVLSGLGIVSALPVGWVHLHDVLHHYELPMIGVSALVLALGWGLHWYTEHVLVDDTKTHTHCCHGPCEPKKNRVHFILKAATVLFVLNVVIYTVFHRGMGIMPGH